MCARVHIDQHKLLGHVTDCVQISCIDIKSTDERLTLKTQEIKYRYVGNFLSGTSDDEWYNG